MKKWLWLFFILITSNCFAETAGITSKEALLKAFQDAVAAKNEKAIINLSYWEGIQEKEKSAFRNKIKLLFNEAENIEGFKFSEISPRDRWEYSEKSIRSKKNLPESGFIEVFFNSHTKLKNLFSIPFPYGKKGDSFYLTQCIKEKMHGKQVYYDVSIMGDPFAKFVGYCIFSEDGQEIKMELNGAFIGGQETWAEGIKYCVVCKTSGKEILVRILKGETEGEKMVEIFRSDMVHSSQPIIYKPLN